MDESAIEVAAAVRAGERKATEVLDEALAAIDAGNDALGAFVHVDERLAREAAEAVDALVAAGEDPGPFAGVPVRGEGPRGLRRHADLARVAASTRDGRRSSTTRSTSPACARPARCRSARRRRRSSARSTSRARRRGGWPAIRGTRARTPGGSSGGSAAAVAAAMLPAATASDGGGSTRIPAAFSGLVGFKPSHGRIPHPGAPGSQTAVYGLLTTTVADSARHLDVVAGPDDRDRFSLPATGQCLRVGDRVAPGRGPAGPLVGRPRLRPVRSRGPGPGRGRGPRAGRRPPGWCSTTSRWSLTDPVHTWLGSGHARPLARARARRVAGRRRTT